MDQRTVKNSISHPNSFVHISDEQLEAYNGASIPGDADFGKSPELGRTLTHFYTNRKLSSDYYQ